MAKDKSSESGEFRMGELTAAVTVLAQSMTVMNTKIDSIGTKLEEGAGKFKDLVHADETMCLRIKAIEDVHAQSAATKQSVAMMFLDKGIGVLLPWSAVAYMVWGKGSP